MNKSILILEQNAIVQGLVASALDMDGLTLHHEFNPSKYLERARTLRPDLILLGNADPSHNYSICRQLKTTPALAEVPLVLLAGSKERLDRAQLQQLKVAGLVRKPFEASDLQQQVSQHLHLLDLMGSGYEYSKSQSAKEEGPNPLEHLDVLEDDVVGLMQQTVSAPPPPVPEVDFTRELQQEAADGAWDEALQGGAGLTPEPAHMAEPFKAVPGDEELDEGPVETFSIGSLEPGPGEDLPPGLAGEPLPELGPEDLLEEESAEESRFAPERFDQPLGGTAAVRLSTLDQIEVELSEDDLSLPEDSVGTGTAGPRRDLLADDLDHVTSGAAQSGLADLPPAVRRMMEHQSVFPKVQPSAPAPPPPPRREEIPPAVQRMMEQKSIFPKAAPGAGRDETGLGDAGLEDVGLSDTGLSDVGLSDMGLSDMEMDEPGLVEPGPDDALFAEAVRLSAEESGDLLGAAGAFEEEAAHLDSLDTPAEELLPLDAADPELLGLTSSEELVLQTLDGEPELQGALAGAEEDEQEISIDEDEEELILSSLEPGAQDELGAPGGTLEPLPDELALDTADLAGMDNLASLEIPADLDSRHLGESLLQSEQDSDLESLMAEDEGEAQLRSLDGAPEPPPEPMRLEPKPSRTSREQAPAARRPVVRTVPLAEPPEPLVGLEAIPPELSFDLDDMDLSEAAAQAEPDSLDGGLPPLDADLPPLGQGLQSLDEAFPPLEGELGGDLGADLGDLDTGLPPLSDELDLSPAPLLAGAGEELSGLDLDLDADSSTGFGAEAASGADAAPDEDSGLGGFEDDFENALAELKGEIAANPEGERLDDLLHMEQLQEKIGKLEFSVPQGENVMARGVGIYALPDQEGAQPAPATAQRTAGRATAGTAASLAAAAGTSTGHAAGSTAAANIAAGGMDSLLDEATKARLSQVLDEIISISVRRAVREEMPRLVERLVKE